MAKSGPLDEQRSEGGADSPKADKTRRKGYHRKGQDLDIFKDWIGKEHEKSSVNEVLVEADLHRWQQSLKDASRYQQHITQVREKWHYDWRTHRHLLTDQHNALFRQRSSAATAVTPSRSTGSLQELHEMQKIFAPSSKRSSARIRDGGVLAVGRPAGAQHGQQDSAVVEPRLDAFEEDFEDVEPAEFQRRFERFGKIVDALSPQVMRCYKEWGECDIDFSEERPASSAFSDAHSLTMDSWEAIQRRERKAHSGDEMDKLPQVQLPQTLSILVFRNADKVHAGEVVLLRRWPPANMASLIEECGQACRPVAGPAKQLLNNDLLPVMSPDEIEPGGAYVLKGPEALDPPATFFSLRPEGALSFGDLSRANLWLSSNFEERLRASSSSGSRTTASSLTTSLQESSTQSKAASSRSVQLLETPPVGSPPWKQLASQSFEASPVKVSKWQEPKFASTALSWGGLSRPTKHHDFRTWGRVLERSPRCGSDQRVGNC